VVRTFCVHQKIDTRSPGRWGKPEDFTDPEQGKCTRPNQSQPIPTDPNPVLEGKGTSLLVNPGGSTDPYGESFSEVWQHYPRKVNRKEALRAYQARRRSGVSQSDLLRATVNYAKAMRGKEDEFVMHGKRFYGPNDVWMEFLQEAPTERVVVDR
jgi:hypothetical protein